MAVGEFAKATDGAGTPLHRQLALLEGGAMLIDTPACAGWACGTPTRFKPGIFRRRGLFRQCRFSDCRHEANPGCAIAEAIREGELAPERCRKAI